MYQISKSLYLLGFFKTPIFDALKLLIIHYILSTVKISPIFHRYILISVRPIHKTNDSLKIDYHCFYVYP